MSMSAARSSVASLVHAGPVQARQQRLVDSVTGSLARGAGKRVDVAEAASVVSAASPRPGNDRAYDGCVIGKDGLFSPLVDVDAVAPVLPNNGAAVTASVIVVNGIMTDVAVQQLDMQALANTGCAVRGVHNATSGMAADLLESVLNKLNLGDTPAIDTLARLLAQGVASGAPVRVIGHSQGALIVARALQIVADALADDGLDAAAVRARLGVVSVETYGGASQSYVDGRTTCTP
jgi:hypothetical protein